VPCFFYSHNGRTTWTRICPLNLSFCRVLKAEGSVTEFCRCYVIPCVTFASDEQAANLIQHREYTNCTNKECRATGSVLLDVFKAPLPEGCPRS
jgi:hypothetical protein